MQVTPVPVDVPRPGRTKSRHSVQLEGLVVSELVGSATVTMPDAVLATHSLYYDIIISI